MVSSFLLMFRSRHRENFQFKYDFIYVCQAEELFPSRDREALIYKTTRQRRDTTSCRSFDLVIETLGFSRDSVPILL